MKIQHTSALLAALVATSLGLVACQQRSSDTATPRADERDACKVAVEQYRKVKAAVEAATQVGGVA